MSTDDNAVSTLQRAAKMAKLGGKTVATPIVVNMVRDQLVGIFRENDAEELEKYIAVQYPIVREELSDNHKNAIRNIAPMFEDELKAAAHPDQILYWLKEPAEWMPPDTPPQTVRETRQCYEVITETPGGEEWLSKQILDLYAIAGFE